MTKLTDRLPIHRGAFEKELHKGKRTYTWCAKRAGLSASTLSNAHTNGWISYKSAKKLEEKCHISYDAYVAKPEKLEAPEPKQMEFKFPDQNDKSLERRLELVENLLREVLDHLTQCPTCPSISFLKDGRVSHGL